MFRKLSRFTAPLLAMSVAFLSGCKNEKTLGGDIPTVSVELGVTSRTSVAFTITTDGASDYAYAILPETEDISDAQSLFEKGTVAMFEGENSVALEDNYLEGGKDYILYAAVRNINPNVYSELYEVSFSTDLGYAEPITMESIRKRGFAYHIEMPEGASAYKHIAVPKADLDAVLAMVGGNYAMYLNVFGLTGTESKTYDFDKTVYDRFFEEGVPSGSEWNIMSGEEYAVLMSPVDESGSVDADAVVQITFYTREAGEAPYDIDVTVSDIQSLSAKLSLTPEEGIETYRVLVDTRASYDSWAFEGEAFIRGAIIGKCADTSREYTGAATIDATGLIPNTEYIVGIVGFDSELRECVKKVSFTSGEPVGLSRR